MNLKEMLKRYGKKYSRILGIKLRKKREGEIFKWFIAAVLFGGRINETIAINTYRAFEKEGLLSFKKMKEASWERLVSVLDSGGYVRYDFSTARNLMATLRLLEKRYAGRLNKLHERAEDSKDLERRLKEFKGVGETTVSIFLRDLRGIWKKADPELSPLAKIAANELRIKDPRRFWEKNKIKGYDFSNFETALMRLGREARRKKCKVRDLL